ncbi:hypothetical protein RRG08_059788 [Elysia crispata]|uniref:Uncharacterized protein n=1 Tax=Elysia crispata TaxID=231223 RepID=A0AAE1EDR8_9GAST|nr:hypothetical protein RRG08_059788 [Elysia crispata]
MGVCSCYLYTNQLPRATARGKCETWESVLVISTQISYPEPQREGSLPRAPARGKCETWESVLVISTQISYPEPQREGSVRHGSLFLLSLHKSATQSPSEREV